MLGYPKSAIVDNVFTYDELKTLEDYFSSQPVAYLFESHNAVSKNLDYEIVGSLANTIIKPRLGELLGDPDHKFFGGAYKEYNIPYQLHIDNTHSSKTFAAEKKHQIAFLIPLMEDSRLKTAMFDVFMPGGQYTLAHSKQEKFEKLCKFLQDHDTSIDMTEFDHIVEPYRSILPRLPVENIIPWKLGSVISWHFDQLHCSTNFAKYGIEKKFILVMIN